MILYTMSTDMKVNTDRAVHKHNERLVTTSVRADPGLSDKI